MQETGTILVSLMHDDADWIVNDIIYDFPDFETEHLRIQYTKVRANSMQVCLEGLRPVAIVVFLRIPSVEPPVIILQIAWSPKTLEIDVNEFVAYKSP